MLPDAFTKSPVPPDIVYLAGPVPDASNVPLFVDVVTPAPLRVL